MTPDQIQEELNSAIKERSWLRRGCVDSFINCAGLLEMCNKLVAALPEASRPALYEDVAYIREKLQRDGERLFAGVPVRTLIGGGAAPEAGPPESAPLAV